MAEGGRQARSDVGYHQREQFQRIDATLAVTGYADHPVIKLTSTPELPQDEILARLLFNESMSQLTPLQIASIAQGVASLSGAGGGFDPLGLMRKTLGIDRLSVSNNSNTANGNSNTTVEAGKYVAEGVYVGTRQECPGERRPGCRSTSPGI